jgi:hypothetical protein
MRPIRLLIALLPVTALVAACDTKAKEQLRTLSHVDSLRTDSLLSVKNELLAESQFENDINVELSKLRSQSAKLSAKLNTASDVAKAHEDRVAIVAKIRELVARLDSSETRVGSLRARARTLAQHDSTLATQIAANEKTIGDLRQMLDQQKTDYEAIVVKQNAQIASLNLKVDTMTKENVRLAGERAALTDTVGQLTTEKNTAYYVIGTKDELVKQGVLVEEGRKRLLVLGGRTVVPARTLDPAKFTKIDRLRDRSIAFPDGEYVIFSRQDPSYASPVGSKGGKLTGGLRIDQPERFWEPSKFLIIVKS